MTGQSHHIHAISYIETAAPSGISVFDLRLLMNSPYKPC